MTTKQKLLTMVWFYIGWFGCVFFARWNMSELSFVFPLLPLLLFIKFNIISSRQLLFLLGFAVIGILFDSIAYYYQWINFPLYNQKLIPVWLVSMWALFVLVFPLSASLLNSKLWLASLLGAIFGPLSYYSGEALQVLHFSNHVSLLIFALFWGVYFPGAIYLFRAAK